MFKKTLTAAVAVLTLTGASLTTTSSAQAGGFGRFVAAGIVGAVVGSVLASRSNAGDRPAYNGGGYGDRQSYQPVSACPYGTHLGPQGRYCWDNN